VNSSLIKRLFRSISNGNSEDLQKIAQTIIEDENRKGHTKLAKELSNMLSSNSYMNPNATFEMSPTSLNVLPKSKRYEIPLATYIPSDQLEHHMILPAEVEKRFQRIEKEYAARERLAQHGLIPRRKILLYGSPGCGKTMGAQRLAWNTGLPFIKVRFDAMVSSYLGETASNLRSIFDTAAQTPCLLFIDECDSLAKSRMASQEVGEIKRVVNSFLQLLDEYDAPGLLVAATNLDDQLDPAVWRRFDDVLEIPKPEAGELKELIKMTLSAVKYNKFDWYLILEETKGFSAAQMVRATRDAAKKAILEGYEIVTNEMMLEAIRECRGGE
jgi:SpoVK/Ycf46/Vps4 family AAA+-type ATPase